VYVFKSNNFYEYLTNTRIVTDVLNE